jgi:hypothetical protein
MGALERIYKQRLAEGRTADAAPLYDILSRKADLAVADVGERTAALAEMAALAAGPLARPDDAIAAWEQVLEAHPGHPEAVPALDAMYRRERRWRDLVDLYERRLGFVETLDEASTSWATSPPRSRATPRRWAAILATPARSPRSSACWATPTAAPPPPRCSSRCTSRATTGPRWPGCTRCSSMARASPTPASI